MEFEESFHFLTYIIQKFISCCVHITHSLLTFISATEIGEAEKVNMVYLLVELNSCEWPMICRPWVDPVD